MMHSVAGNRYPDASLARHSGRAGDDRETPSIMLIPTYCPRCTSLTPCRLASTRPHCVIEYAAGWLPEQEQHGSQSYVDVLTSCLQFTQ